MKNKLYGLRRYNINHILVLQGLKKLTFDNIFILVGHFKNHKYTDIFKMISYNNFTYFIFKNYIFILKIQQNNLYIIKKMFYSIDLSLVNYNELRFLFCLLFYYNTDLKLFDKTKFFYFRLYNYVKKLYLKYNFNISILKEHNIFNEIQKCPYI